MNSYAAAVAAERDARDYAFLGLPLEICGIDVLPMTVRQFIARCSILCPFLRGVDPYTLDDLPGEIASFLWHISLARARTLRAPLLDQHLAKVRLVAHVASGDVFATLEGLVDYIETTFLDAPAGGDGDESAPAAERYVSVAATLIDLFGSEYHWTRDAVLDAPLVQLYQLLRARTLRYKPDAVLFNRKSTRARRLAVLNGENIFGAPAPVIPSGVEGSSDTSQSDGRASAAAAAAAAPAKHLDCIGAADTCRANVETIQ